MAKSSQDVEGVNFVKDANGKVLVENDQVKEEWRKYMEVETKVSSHEGQYIPAGYCHVHMLLYASK